MHPTKMQLTILLNNFFILRSFQCKVLEKINCIKQVKTQKYQLVYVFKIVYLFFVTIVLHILKEKSIYTMNNNLH